MHTWLSDLIGRMIVVEQVTHSDHSISWHAHREAEQIRDLAILDELSTFIASSKSKDERKAAYFLLGALGANTADVRCADALNARLSVEKDKYVLAAILEALAKLTKPRDFPLGAIFQHLSDKRWLVRHTAIRALLKTDSENAEAQLLKHLSATTDPDDMIYCHATLGSIGTAASIPLIEIGRASRKRDVRASAEIAIEAIKSRVP